MCICCMQSKNMAPVLEIVSNNMMNMQLASGRELKGGADLKCPHNPPRPHMLYCLYMSHCPYMSHHQHMSHCPHMLHQPRVTSAVCRMSNRLPYHSLLEALVLSHHLYALSFALSFNKPLNKFQLCFLTESSCRK